MRVAQVVASYPPVRGGVETHVRRVAEELALAGDEVTVLTHQPGGLPAEEAVGPVRVLRFPLTVDLANYPLSLPLFGYLRAHASDFDVVHAHSYHTLVGQAAIRTGLPFVFTPHYHGTGHTRLRALLHRLYRPAGGRLFAAADAVICHSAAERDLVTGDFPAAAGKVRVIPAGTDPRSAGIPRQRAAAGTGRAEQVVLAIGRLERYKRMDLIITACRALGAEVTLVVVGDGPDRPRLERLASELALVARVARVARSGSRDGSATPSWASCLPPQPWSRRRASTRRSGSSWRTGWPPGRASSPPPSPRTVRSAAWPGPTRRSCTSIRPTPESSPPRWRRHWRWAGRRPAGCGCPPGARSRSRCASCTGGAAPHDRRARRREPA